MGILSSQTINPSLKSVSPKDARYDDGVYLSDLIPGTKTQAQLSYAFLGIPYQGKKYSKYIAIDVTGLNVTRRDSVYVINTSVPLNITGRIMGFGNVPAKN